MSDTNTAPASPARDHTVILETDPEASSSSQPLPSNLSNEGNQEKNTAKLMDTTELIQALAIQMQYYFSSKNLAQDTYLNTIMKLNSGFVPITILSGFTNINRIIARYANGIDIADIDVHALLSCSAVQSKVLKIVLLDQDGSMIASHGAEGYEDQKGPTVFEAIGSCEGRGIEGNQGDAQVKDETKESSTGTSSTVILRDVPEEATEEDILRVFEDDDGNVVSSGAQKEVGQCWYVQSHIFIYPCTSSFILIFIHCSPPIIFAHIVMIPPIVLFDCRFVTIDASTSQQDLVSILLSLRSKTICNEPIKARLKTQSIAIQGVPMQGSGYNPHRPRVYTGDRASYSKKFTNKPHLKQRGGGKGGDYNGSSTYKGTNHDSKKAVKPAEKASPPPPLVEEHFPGLDGSPKSVDVSDSTNAETEVVKKDIIHASGYAAALKKAAPPVTEVATDNPKRSKPKSPTRPKVCDFAVNFCFIGVMTIFHVSL
jgi:hypothetical protein